MKKANLVKAICLLTCLCLITSCFIGSTLAKYTTSASANDTARVAKFGVDIAATGSLFSTQYVDSTGGNVPGSTNLTVTSSTADKLVAPGTQNDTGITFSLTGAPEVSVAVAFSVTVNHDVFLKGTTGNAAYTDLTTAGDPDDFFTVAADYYPVVFTLENGAGTQLATGNLTAIKTYLEGLSKTVAPNTDLATTSFGANIDGTYKLTWAWAFSADAAQDKKDTVLGDLAAATPAAQKTADSTANPIVWGALTNGTDYDLAENVEISISVTQVD